MKKKREKRSMALLAAAIAAALFVSGCSSDEAAPPEVKYTAVETMTAGTGTLKDEFAYSGKVTPSREINVMSAVAGKVSRVNYAVGDYVEEGAVLFSLEKTDVQNNINILTASMGAAEANIAVSQISLDTAQDALEKNKTLREAGAISQHTYEQIESSYKQAQAGLEAAIASRDSVAAQIASAQKTLGDCDVKSPMSGIVSACNVKAGEFMSQAMAPFSIIQTDSVKIEVNVSEQIINSLASGQSVEVKVSSVSAEPFLGVIETVSPAANQTGGYPVKIVIENPEGTLKSGMFGEAVFTKGIAENAVVLPREAVITKNGESYVFVVKDSVVHKQNVEIGIDTGEDIEIKSGLAAADEVVVKGQTYLVDGETVNVVTADKEA